MSVCFWLAQSQGRLDGIFERQRWPDISVLGIGWPERAWFTGGFTLLCALMLALFLGRAWQLARVPAGRSWNFGNGLTALVGVAAVVCMVVMAWIPANVSRWHFDAAVSGFGFLAVYELAHALLCVRLVARGLLGRGLLGWLFLCPLGVIAGVYLWITQHNALWQYGAVVLLFAYFLPLSGVLGRDHAEG